MGKRKSKDSNLPGFWSLPAGHCEAHASSFDTLEKNLKREVWEEIGCKIKIKAYLDSHSWVTPEYFKLTVVFLCSIIAEKPWPKLETQAVRWFAIKELKSMALPPNVLRVLEKATDFS